MELIKDILIFIAGVVFGWFILALISANEKDDE